MYVCTCNVSFFLPLAFLPLLVKVQTGAAVVVVARADDTCLSAGLAASEAASVFNFFDFAFGGFFHENNVVWLFTPLVGFCAKHDSA